MRRSHLFTLFEQARQLIGQTEYVVVGSLAILGTQDEPELPAGMSMSIDVDCYTLLDPGRIHDLKATLGEGSAFHKANGYFLDPVSPNLPTLPEGWQPRLCVLEHETLRIWCLDPDDAAISKYARNAPNDQRWIRSGLLSGLISLPRVVARLALTRFLDAEESARAHAQVALDQTWFERVRRGRESVAGQRPPRS